MIKFHNKNSSIILEHRKRAVEASYESSRSPLNQVRNFMWMCVCVCVVCVCVLCVCVCVCVLCVCVCVCIDVFIVASSSNKMPFF